MSSEDVAALLKEICDKVDVLRRVLNEKTVALATEAECIDVAMREGGG